MSNKNLYYSTNLRAPHVTFREALLKGLAPDGGLYMPLRLPKITNEDLELLNRKSYPETASYILGRLLDGEIAIDDLKSICNEIYDFDIRIEKITGRNYAVRLDQGPTASFKDFAAQFMGRAMQYFLNIDNRHLTILTATSGDTGAAAIDAVKNKNLPLADIDCPPSF